MPADEEIESPPYPNEGVNPDGLYNTLKALRKWVQGYRPGHNRLVGQDLIPAVKELPDKKAYVSQPVLDQFGHFLTLRRMREHWDHLVRTYEVAWDDPMCVRQRVLLLQAAALLINNAFIPFEHREARRKQELEEIQTMFSRIQEVLLKSTEPKRHEPDAGKGKQEGGTA